MSAIYGVWLKNGGDLPHKKLDAMSEALKHMGPDKHEVHAAGNVFMGRHMFWTTPESYHESFPAQDPNQRVRVNFNGRIDYREELLEKLGLPATDITRWSDPEYVALAYLHFGTETFLQHLYGDFVFALWDAEKEALLLAKDRTGFKGLFYYENAEAVYYASTIKALQDLVPNLETDQTYLVDFIIDNYEESYRTLYTQIQRVQVCHYVHYSRAGKNRRPYYQYHIQPAPSFQTDREYFDAFRNLLDAAVKERARSVAPVAASLSGGLDSSSICFLLQHHLPKGQDKLWTFSQLQNDDGSPKDQPYIEEAIRQGNFLPTCYQFDLEQYKKDFETSVSSVSEPHSIFNIGISSMQWRDAYKKGVRVYMEGIGGDAVIPYGNEMLAHRIKYFQISKLLRQQRASQHHSYMPHFGLQDVIKRFGKFWIKQILGKAGTYWYKGGIPIKSGPYSTRIAGVNHRKYAKTLNSGKMLYLSDIRDAIHSKDFMNFEALTQCYNPMEIAAPFYDVRLMEFMLSLPMSFLNRYYTPRFMYRHGLAGVLPEKIRERSSKGQFAEVTAHARGLVRPDDLKPILKLNAGLTDFLLEKSLSLRTSTKFISIKNVYEGKRSSSKE